jgi:hypothetical protein
MHDAEDTLLARVDVSGLTRCAMRRRRQQLLDLACQDRQLATPQVLLPIQYPTHSSYKTTSIFIMAI